MKPANTKARDLLGKLERLADPANGGTADEIATANRKLQRLKDRFDFTTAAPADTADIFAGIKPQRRARRAARIHTFHIKDFDVANSVKWAIEKTTGIPCLFRGQDLLAEVPAATAKRLSNVALHISQSFKSLLEKLDKLTSVTASDRMLFVRGLYDGMMNDARGVGESLPTRGGAVGQKKPEKNASAPVPRLAIHPYTVAFSLGKQIRFAAPIDQITGELERATQAAIGQ